MVGYSSFKLSEVQLSKIRSSTFLVTGGGGFIGSHIIAYLLEAGAKKVRALDNFATGQRGNIEPFINDKRFQLLEGDITNLDTCRQACREVDFVSHQAALGSVPRSVDDPITSNNVNITGHLNMLIACRDTKVKKMVYAASSSTYGDSQELPKREAVIGQPLSPYAVTKYVNELYASVFFRTYGLSTIGLRYFNVFGPRQNPQGPYAAVIPLFIEAVKAGVAPFINGDGEQTRDFTFVENAVQANLLSMLNERPEADNQVYNIACGENISLNALFFKIVSISGHTDILPVYRESRLGDVRNSLADISKAKTLLGYHPGVDVTRGLDITYKEWDE